MGVLLLAALRIGLLYPRLGAVFIKNELNKKIIQAGEKQLVHTQRAETVG